MEQPNDELVYIPDELWDRIVAVLENNAITDEDRRELEDIKGSVIH